MHHALSYPEARIYDPVFLFNSLLYWDRVACIVPSRHFEPYDHQPWRGDDFARALRPLVDECVDGFVPVGGPESTGASTPKAALLSSSAGLGQTRESIGPDQGILFPPKVGEETLNLLRDCGWLDLSDGEEEGTMAAAAVNLILDVLAQECSSRNLVPITADPAAFRASCNALLYDLGASSGLALAGTQLRSGS